MYYRLILLCLLISQFCVNAQNWESIGNRKINFAVEHLYADTGASKLYATGLFWMIDTTTAYGLAVLDTAEWDNAFTDPVNNSQKRVVTFQGSTYVSKSPYLLKWNGISWDTIADAPGLLNLYNDGDSVLYLMGNFTTVNSIPISMIAKYDGTTVSSLDGTIWSGGAVMCAYRYQGDMYFGGLFYNSGLNIWRVGRWDGSTWNSLGNGITGSIAFVSSLIEYNGFLYVGGYFDTAQGNPGNYIARWDGNNWTQVGGGLWAGQVNDMEVFNNELWVGGSFSYAGGVPSQHLARFNGLDWCSVGMFDNAVSSLAVHNNELYVGGGFWTVDGDSVNKVVKWIGGSYADSCGHLSTTVQEYVPESTVSFNPNPVSGLGMFQFTTSEHRTIVVTDQLGREVWRNDSRDLQTEFPANEFADGLYYFMIIVEDEVVESDRLIIQH